MEEQKIVVPKSPHSTNKPIHFPSQVQKSQPISHKVLNKDVNLSKDTHVQSITPSITSSNAAQVNKKEISTSLLQFNF
jgi:hypothetical protein